MKIQDQNKEALYFIAIVPPSPIHEEALALKEVFRDSYQSKAALNSPPHITLHMPFGFKLKKEEKLVRILEEFAAGQEAFTLEFKDFGAFPPRVIFMDVEKNIALESLQAQLKLTCRQQLNLHNANYRERAFHPHLTLAFRDLRKAQFNQAWQEFQHKGYKAHFEVNSLWLLKHDGKKWELYREFSFV